MSNDITIERLKNKIRKRDQKIAGLERRIAKLEHSLSLRANDAVVVSSSQLRRDLENAVTEALCNVRMIPVLGFGKDTKIIEIRAFDEGKK